MVVAIDPPFVKLESLDQRVKSAAVGLRADAIGVAPATVLDLQDRLARVDERLEQIALVVLGALLVDVEVDQTDEFGGLVDVILQPDRQSAGVRLVGEEGVVVELIVGGEGKPVRIW